MLLIVALLNCCISYLYIYIYIFFFFSIFKFGYFIKKEKRKIKRYNIMQLVKQKSNTQNGIK